LGALGFKIWIFAPKSCLFGGIRVRNLNFRAKNLGFPSVFCQNNASKLELSVSCLFTFSAVCLHFRQLFVYFFVSWLFTLVSCLFTIWIFAPKTLVCHQSFVKIMLQSWKPHLIVYIFSCLFTFSSAICLLFCQLIVYFCQLFVYNLNFRAKIMFFHQSFAKMMSSSLKCQLIVYIFSCLFTFVSWLFTFSAVCLLLSAVCLLFVSWFQLFVYFLSADSV